jgi:hypothetical protein
VTSHRLLKLSHGSLRRKEAGSLMKSHHSAFILFSSHFVKEVKVLKTLLLSFFILFIASN